jgi:hypothetical protein
MLAIDETGVYEVYGKVLGLVQLNLLNFGCHLLQIISLGTYTAIPSFFPCFNIAVEVIFLNATDYRLQFPLDVREFQNFVHSVSFSTWETNSTFVTRYDPRDKIWVLVSLLS